jgi:hypothetical protein
VTAPPATAAPARRRPRTARVLDRLDWGYASGRYRALDFDFAFRVPDPALGRHLADALSPLRAEGQAAHLYSLVDRGHGRRRRFALYLDGERIEHTDPPAAAAAMLPWHVNRMAVQRSPRFLFLHAAAVATDGDAVLLAAPQEAGKTTLATGLVRAGMTYLTDEAVAVEPETMLLHPYPKALSIDPGAQPLFPDLCPPLEAAARAWDHGQWAVDPTRIRPDAVSGLARVRAVVLPAYDADGHTALTPISRAATVLELVQQCFNFTLHGRRGFETLVSLVRNAECYRLPMADLDTAVEAVLGLVGERRRIA